MDHGAHVPGTVDGCDECRSVAIEPGWYRALRDQRVWHRRPDRVAIPDAGLPDHDIVIAESRQPGVVIPDLETSA
jgi:hypothetical protein